MASLLSLPAELLDRIIDLVLLAQRAAPPDPEAAAVNRWSDDDLPMQSVRGLQSWDYGPTHVRYEHHEVPANATGLLLACRPLHEQTQDALRRLWPKGMVYYLDVMVVDGCELWPTWLHVPAVSKHPTSIHVSFRIYERHQDPAHTRDLEWAFYYLLERFLRCGLAHPPATPKGHPYAGNSISSIESITLDFSDICIWTPGNPEPDYTPRQEGLAKTIEARLQWLTRMDYHTAAFGQILYERIGSIDGTVGGEQRWAFLLGEELARLEFRPGEDAFGQLFETATTFGHLPAGCRFLTAWNWKYRTVQRRIRLGLNMPGPIAWLKLDLLRDWRRQVEGAEKIHGCCCQCFDRGLEEMLEIEAEAAG